MKKICTILMFIIFLSLTNLAFSLPIAVKIYKNGGEIKETLLLTKNIKDTNIYLPGYIDLNSFVILSSPLIKYIEIKNIPNKLCPITKDLIKQIKQIKGHIKILENEIHINKVRITFWENLINNKLQRVQDLKKLDKSIYNNLKKLYSIKKELNIQLNRSKEALNSLNKKLSSLTDGYDYFYKIHLNFLHKLNKSFNLTYKYFSPKIKWDSEFYMHFYPQKNTSTFKWYGKIEQETGFNWKNVKITLSTLQRAYTLNPPPLKEWEVGEHKRIFYQRAKKSMPIKMMAPSEAFLKDSSMELSLPRIKKGFIAQDISIGKISIDSGNAHLVTIRNFSFPTKYDYLIRPLECSRAFLRAKIKINPKQKQKLYCNGKVSLFLENNFLGKTFVSLQKEPLEVFLGPDTEVKVKNIELKDISGSKGLISKKKTREFLWRLEIKNLKLRPINIAIEVPWPKIRDKRIVVKNLAKDFILEGHTLIKYIYLKPGEKQYIDYGFVITYPKDMEIYITPFKSF